MGISFHDVMFANCTGLFNKKKAILSFLYLALGSWIQAITEIILFSRVSESQSAHKILMLFFIILSLALMLVLIAAVLFIFLNPRVRFGIGSLINSI